MEGKLVLRNSQALTHSLKFAVAWPGKLLQHSWPPFFQPAFPQLPLGTEGSGSKGSWPGRGDSSRWCNGGSGRRSQDAVGQRVPGISFGREILESEQQLSITAGSAAPPTVLTSTDVTEQSVSPAKCYVSESCCILLPFTPVNIYKENEIFTALIHPGLRSLMKKNLCWFSSLLNYYIRL